MQLDPEISSCYMTRYIRTYSTHDERVESCSRQRRHVAKAKLIMSARERGLIFEKNSTSLPSQKKWSERRCGTRVLTGASSKMKRLTIRILNWEHPTSMYVYGNCIWKPFFNSNTLIKFATTRASLLLHWMVVSSSFLASSEMSWRACVEAWAFSASV